VAGPTGCGQCGVGTTPRDACSTTGFTIADVASIYRHCEGRSPDEDWYVCGWLGDGRCFFLEAGCCDTGWDCEGGGHAVVSATLASLIRFGMGDDSRVALGLEVGNRESGQEG
jgi:hypothetical protein